MDNPIDEQPAMIIYPPVIKHGVLEHLSFVDDFSNFSSYKHPSIVRGVLAMFKDTVAGISSHGQISNQVGEVISPQISSHV